MKKQGLMRKQGRRQKAHVTISVNAPVGAIKVVGKQDRGSAILKDPDGYFSEARKRAKVIVARDLARERSLEDA